MADRINHSLNINAQSHITGESFCMKKPKQEDDPYIKRDESEEHLRSS